MTPEQESRFLEELIGKVSPAYEIFRGAEGLNARAGKLVDLIVAEQLRVPAGFAGHSALGGVAIEAWANSVEGAKPYRNSMQLILDRFPEWWTLAQAGGNGAALAKQLPLLGPAAADVGDAGVAALLAAGEPALACAASYALADKHAVQAIVKVANAGRGDPARCSAVLQDLAAAFPISMIEDSREAERFLPALGKAVDAAGNGWAEAVELATALVRNDASSAYGALEAVPKALAAAGDKKAYLAQFAALVRTMGNRVSGVCLKRLAAAATAGPSVERALELAGRYGVSAAERYLETSL